MNRQVKLFYYLSTLSLLVACNTSLESEVPFDELAGSNYKIALEDMDMAGSLQSQIGDYADIMCLFSNTMGGKKAWKDKHEPLSYHNFYIDVWVKKVAVHNHDSLWNKWYDNVKERGEYYRKMGQISKTYFTQLREWCTENYDVEKCPKPGTQLYPAKICGDIHITSDKTLFGKKPGEDISEHFGVKTCVQAIYQLEDDSLKVLCTYEEMPSSVSEYFCQGSLLADNYVLYLRDIPEEIYDDVSFTMEIPVCCEYLFDYMLTLQNNPDAEVPTKYRAFTSTAKLIIGEYSKFIDRTENY